MKKSKTQKGITLIALIITIVVLLILAVVTINAIQGDGIIRYAQNAADDYTRESNAEQETLNTLLEQIQGMNSDDNGTGITTQAAVAAGLSVGDYVSYPVEYTNVGTWVDSSSGQVKGNYPLDTYTGWRVLSIEGTGEETYLRLIPAGVPLNYYHYGDSATTVANLTTGFFNTPINSTLTQYNFYSCGFKDASGNAITNMDDLKTLFTNKYTQVEGTTPKVQSITKEDLDKVYGGVTSGGTSVASNDLLAIPCKSPEDSEYAQFWLAAANGGGGVWYVYYYGGVNAGGNVSRCASCSFSKV